jgi:hypothetical protein
MKLPICLRRRLGRWRSHPQGPRAAAVATPFLNEWSPSLRMPIGINLDPVGDGSPAWIFRDAFQASRSWTAHALDFRGRIVDWDVGHTQPLALDRLGTPTNLVVWRGASGRRLRQAAGTLLFHRIGGAYPAGRYRAEWQGSGWVRFSQDARVARRGRSAGGGWFADLWVRPSDAGMHMMITRTDPKDPVRCLRIWMPDGQGQLLGDPAEGSRAAPSPFHPLFLERLRPFKILRFMQTQETNSSTIRSWSDRRSPLAVRQSSGDPGPANDPALNGVAPELMLRLAEELGADPWFNLPHGAEEDFVLAFAEMARATLAPERRVYIEWSNEVWHNHPAFGGNRWLTEQLRLPANQGLTAWQVAGRRARWAMELCSRVFKEEPSRLRRVAAGCLDSTGVSAAIAHAMEGAFDVVAIGAYLRPLPQRKALYTPDTPVADVLADLKEAIPHLIRQVRHHRRLADAWASRLGRPIQLVAYEGGFDLQSENPSLARLFHATLNDPRLAEIFAALLESLDQASLDLYVDFCFTGPDRPSPWGDHAKLHELDTPLASAPRYVVLQRAALAAARRETG